MTWVGQILICILWVVSRWLQGCLLATFIVFDSTVQCPLEARPRVRRGAATGSSSFGSIYYPHQRSDGDARDGDAATNVWAGDGGCFPKWV